MSSVDGVRPVAPSKAARAGHGLAYLAMIAAAVGLFLLVNWIGSGLSAPAASAGEVAARAASKGSVHVLPHVLITLVAVIVAGQVIGRLFRFIGQPPVVGEVLAGILLGPSLLGRIWPEATAFLMPIETAPFITVIAQLGVILYMFLVGLELNPAVMRERAATTLAISHASIALPFVLGASLALYLYPRLSNDSVSFTDFGMFMGVAMSITAFPVLARILTDRNLHTTPLGITALAAAAADDVTAWCLLALIVGVAQASVSGAVITLLLALAFAGCMVLIVRPLLTRLIERHDAAPLTEPVMALVFIGVLLSALATEAIGIHALFGAFLLGAITPHDSRLAKEFAHRVEQLVTILLLPAFFAAVGLRTQIGLVSGLGNWLMCGAIIAVATIGKFGGTYAASRITGLDRKNAAGLGVLMNTRGLMELIVLNIGLEMKIISPTLFAMMVIMALVTTLATGPALWLLGVDRQRDAVGSAPA
jgi:Kef-type K+ transport system membrane component KefB